MKCLFPASLILVSSIASAAPVSYVFHSDNPWIEVTVGDAAAATALTSSPANPAVYGSFTYDNDLIGVNWPILDFQVTAWATSVEAPATGISFYESPGWYQTPAQDGISIGVVATEQMVGNYSLFFAELQFWQDSSWFDGSNPPPPNLNLLQGIDGFLELCFNGTPTSNFTCLRVHDITVEQAAVPVPNAAWLLLSALLTLPKIKRR